MMEALLYLTAVAAVGTIGYLVVWTLPKWFASDVADLKDRLTLENDVRKTWAQILVGVFVLIGLMFTWQTVKSTWETVEATRDSVDIARRSQIADRFTRAIDQLANDEQLQSRLGGIYSLQHIAQESPEDYHATVVEVLGAFVRVKSSRPSLTNDQKMQDSKCDRKDLDDEVEIDPPNADVQAALTVVGRIGTKRDEAFKRLNLRDTCLPKVNLVQANLPWADFSRADLRAASFGMASLMNAFFVEANLTSTNFYDVNLMRAWMWDSDCTGARFEDADLTGVNLRHANLSEANLEDVTLQGATLHGANLTGANLKRAYLFNTDLTATNLKDAVLTGATLIDVDFTNSTYLTQGQIDSACVHEKVQLPDGIKRPPPCENRKD